MTRTQLLLAHVAEEAVEVAQRATKALRFGMDEVQEGQDLNNAQRMMIELGDLFCVIEMLQEETGGAFVDDFDYEAHTAAKRAKVERYLALSESEGVLDAPAAPVPGVYTADQGGIVNPNWIVGLLVALYAGTRLYGIVMEPKKAYVVTTLRVVTFIVAVCVVFMIATGMWTVTSTFAGAS